MTYGFIYKIVFPNGKHYIGLTRRSIQRRKCEHYISAKNDDPRRLYCALRKYEMVDTFELVKIYTSEIQEELEEKETEYIQMYNSFIGNNGYNMTLGGDGCNGYVFTDEDKLKMSEIKKQHFIDNPDARKQLSEIVKKYYEDNPDARKQLGEKMKKYYEDNPEERKQMSEIKKQHFIDNPELGKQQGEQLKKYYEDNPDARKQMSEIKKQHFIDNPDARKQLSEKKKQYFIDNPDAGKQHGEKLKQSHIDNPELGKQHGEKMKQRFIDNPDAGKQHGEKMKKYYIDNPEAIYKALDARGFNKPFDIFTTDGTFVKTFTYQIDAQKYLQTEYNITKNIDIGCVLKGRQNSCAGFVFKYK